MSIFRRSASILSIAMAAFLLIAPTLPAAAQTATPKRGGTLVFALASDPGTLNRNIGSNNEDGHIACVIYQGLTRMDAKLDPQPMLAKSWTVSPDGLTYTFDLVKTNWEDGKPMTSEDVKYTLLEISTKYSAVFAGAGRMIDGIDTPAPDKVVIRLKAPYGPFLVSLACQQGGAILPKHVYEGTNPLQNPATTTKPVGLGPFLLKEWKRGDHIRLARNPNYYEPGKPYLDEIVAKIIPQPATRTSALQSGEVDFVSNYYLALNDLPIVKADPKLEVVRSPTPPGITFLFLNVKHKPLDNKKVRQALFVGIDRDLIIHSAYSDIGTVGTMPFPAGITWAANPDIDYRKMYAYDPARANAMLDEAGMKRGADGTRFKLTFLIASTDKEGGIVAQAIKSMWKTLGIDVTIDAVDRTTATKRMYTDYDADVFMNGYTSFGDPALGMARAWITSSIGKAFGNGSEYSNPAVDKLFEEGEQGVTREQRGAAYKKVQAILADELPAIALRDGAWWDGMSRKVHGIEDEQFLITWRDAWRD